MPLVSNVAVAKFGVVVVENDVVVAIETGAAADEKRLIDADDPVEGAAAVDAAELSYPIFFSSRSSRSLSSILSTLRRIYKLVRLPFIPSTGQSIHLSLQGRY